MKNIFTCLKYSFLIIGAIVGAGLASGQEIVIFFAQYGFISLFFLPFLFYFFYIGIKQSFIFGKISYSCDFNNKTREIKLYKYLSIFFLIVIGAAMLSGINNLCSGLIFDFGFPIYSLAIIIISSIVVFFGIRIILKISILIVPLIFFGIMFICIKTLICSPTSAPAFSTDFQSLTMLTFNSISYCCCNVITINKVLQNCSIKLNLKQIKIVSFIVSLVIFLLILVVTLTLLLSDNAIIFYNLPLVYLAYYISSPIGLGFSVVMFFSILTTLVSAQYSFTEITSKAINRDKLYKAKNIILVGIIFFVFSLIGFNGIIKYFYPLIGAFGFIAYIYSKELSSKFSFYTTNNKVHPTSK